MLAPACEQLYHQLVKVLIVLHAAKHFSACWQSNHPCRLLVGQTKLRGRKCACQVTEGHIGSLAL